MNLFIFIATFLVAFGFGLTFSLLSKLAQLINDDCRRLNKCKFKPLDNHNCLFETSCGREFYNGKDDGDLVTSWLNYCPFCGGKAEQTKHLIGKDGVCA